jgi:hypothetical protein
MTAREIVDLIKKNVGVPWNDQSYRDTFKLGDPVSTVKGIATTVMVTLDMLKRANLAGLNMVISHEDTFWNDRDETKDLTENPIYRMKTEFVKKNGMIVWRIHDHMHAMRPDYTVVGSLRSVGIKGGEDAVMRPRVFTIPETTLGEFASQVKRLTGSRAFRCVGDPRAKVSRILLGPGYATPRMTAEADVVITGTADCGSCTAYSVYDGIELEKAGRPAIVVTTTEFRPIAETMAEHFGLPELRIVVLPHPIGGTEPDTLSRWADDAVDTVLALCTRRAAA